MRFFDADAVGVYLDAVTLRLEKTKDSEDKVIDLTLRVQPFTPDLAVAVHPDVRALLFTLSDATPKPLIKSTELRLASDRQRVTCSLFPEEQNPRFIFRHVEISDPRVRTEKGVDGYALIFYATIGPLDRDQLEYIVSWYTEQRFLSFEEEQPALEFDPLPTPTVVHRAGEPDMTGDLLAPGVHAEH